MKKNNIYLIVFFSITMFSSCLAQSHYIKQLENGYNSLGIKFINDKIFKESRRFALNKVKKESVRSDTLIFIESFIDVTGKYSYGFYDTKTIHCYDIISKDGGKRKSALKIVSTNLCTLNSFIVKSIKEGNLRNVLEKGEKQSYTPNTTLIISIAIKKGEDHNVKIYKTNSFKL